MFTRFMIAILASFLCSVTAFVPTRSAQSSRMAVSMAAERSKSLPFLLKPAKLDGSLAGDEGFDPLGLSNIDDLGIDLYWLAEAELKHARVAMLAVVGLLAQEAGFVAPGFPTGKSQVDLFWTIFDEHPAPIVSAFLFLGVAECKCFTLFYFY